MKVYVHIEKSEYTEKTKTEIKNYMQSGEDHSSFRVSPCSLLNMYLFAFFPSTNLHLFNKVAYLPFHLII